MCEYIIAEDFDMDKYIFDEGNGLWYELIGDYYFPCLTVPTEEAVSYTHLTLPTICSGISKNTTQLYTMPCCSTAD